jgi:hypothetical protein
MPREENIAAYKAQRKTKPKTRPKPVPHTDSADTARRRDEINRQFEADRQAELRRRIPTATTAKTPRRKPMTRDEQLALAIDLAVRREPAFKKSARNTRLSSFARDWVFGKALAEPGFNPRDPDEWSDLAVLAGVTAAPAAAARGGVLAASRAPRFAQANKVRVLRPPHTRPLSRRARSFVLRNVYRHGSKVGVAEVLSQPENFGAVLRVAQGRGTEEDYRRVALIAGQAGGTGALLRSLRRVPVDRRLDAGPWIGEGLRTLHDFGDDD